MLTTFQNSDQHLRRQKERERNMQIIQDAMNIAPFSNIEEGSTGAAVDSLMGEPLEKLPPIRCLPSEEDESVEDRKRIHPLFWGLALVVVVIVASVLMTRSDNEDSMYDPKTDPILVDRYHRIYAQILEWDVTKAADLDVSESSPAKALDWLAYQDIHTKENENLRTRFALATLYFSTFANSSSWHSSTYWLSEYPVCFWYGIECAGKEDDPINLVQSLNLSSNGLVGTLPDELALLKYDCASLDLSKNSIHGSIPEQYGNHMHKLQRLFLGQNMLSGALPESLFQLTDLKHLYIESCQLSGTLPTESFGQLSNLQGMAVHENYLWGNIPSKLGNLSHLRILYLDTNAFTGPIPSSIAHLTGLVDLRLNDNRLSGELPTELSELRMLEILYLHKNKLSGPLSKIEFDRMPLLTEVQMHQNEIDNEIPASIGSLALLQVLYLDGNLLSSQIPVTLANNRLLESLYLNNNYLSGPIPVELGDHLRKLSNFRVQENRLTGDVPSSLGNLVALETLYLNNNTLGGQVPTELGRLYSLKEARFHGNAITGSFPNTWCSSHGGLFSPAVEEFTADCKRANVSCDCCTFCYA